MKVAVLEAADTVGGAAVTDEFLPGFRNSAASYTVSLLQPKVIREMQLERHGLKVDVRGNVFCTEPGGVWVCRANGTLLGRIVLPELPANLAWGEDGSVLFLTARTSVYRLPTKTRRALLV